MKKTISYMILFIIGISGFTLKAGEISDNNVNLTLTNESLQLNKNSILFSSLVWDKNKITLKKINRILVSNSGKMQILAGIPIKQMIINGEIYLSEPAMAETLSMSRKLIGWLD